MNNLLIYCDQVNHFYFGQYGSARVTDWHTFQQNEAEKKISAFSTPFEPDENWAESVRLAHNISDHTFVFVNELNDFTVPEIKKLDLPNTSIYLAGALNTFEFKSAQVYFYPFWISSVTNIYRRLPVDFLDNKLTADFPKPLVADVLLGRNRLHRNFIYDHIYESDFKNQCVLTYIDRERSNPDTKFLVEPDNLELVDGNKILNSVDPVIYHGVPTTMSAVVPVSIYNQTAYSLVTETNFTNDYSFYTEKTVKPMLAQRLFILVAGQYYLRNLRNIGFCTFDGIIDESYDLEPDAELRWALALDQLKWLATQDQRDIMQRARPMIEHNYQLVQQNWQANLEKKLNLCIDSL